MTILRKTDLGCDFTKGNIWRTFTNFSPDCVVMVLASMHYDEADYIRNYDEFWDKVKCCCNKGNGVVMER